MVVNMGVFGGGFLVFIAILIWAGVLLPAVLQNRSVRNAEKRAVKIEQTLARLDAVAQETGEDRLVSSAKAALNREKVLKLERQRQKAQNDAALAAAKAAKKQTQLAAKAAEQFAKKKARSLRKLHELEAKRAAKIAKAKLRNARLASPNLKALRLLCAGAVLCGFVCVFVGTGLLLAGKTALVLGVAFTACAIGLIGLTVLAPGRAEQQEISETPARTVAVKQPKPQKAKPQPKINAEVQPVDSTAVRHAALQKQAAERIATAKARAASRTHKQAQPIRNQTDSILLTDQPKTPRAVPEPEIIVPEIPELQNPYSADTVTVMLQRRKRAS